MNNHDYYTVSRDAEETVIIQKSRFIGRCFRVEREQDALERLEAVRKRHWDASHNCFAYIIGAHAARYSDDGEPGGTAGLPMMEVLKAKYLQNTLIVITRYFGGVLLGAGGLVRAYSKTAAAAIEAAGIAHMVYCRVAELQIDYNLWGKLEHKLRSLGANIISVDFGERVTMRAAVPADEIDEFVGATVEMSDGKLKPALNEWIHYALNARN